MKNTQDTLLGFVLNLFVSLPEPRRRHCRVYPLEMLLFCAMATFITGRKSFYDMNAFAEVYKDLLIELFGVSSTPSHDTFARIFRILDKKLLVKSGLVCKIAFRGQRVMAAWAAITRCCSFAISISVFMTSGVMNSLKVLGLKRALPDCL